MILGIVGTGQMGKVLRECAAFDSAFDTICVIEPLDESTWPDEKVDLLIDFSHPKAIGQIYSYCEKQGGGIPVVIATTGFDMETHETVEKLKTICPVDMRSNFSKGASAAAELAKACFDIIGRNSDIRIVESHHKNKKDAPSGTARTLCDRVGITPEEYSDKVSCLRMGTVFGEHTIFFAMEDEIVEIKHTAFSKKIFALGAIEAGKELLSTQKEKNTCKQQNKK